MNSVKHDKSFQTPGRRAFSCTLGVAAIDLPIASQEQLESGEQWARLVHIELVSPPGIPQSKAIEADLRMNNGVLALDMRSPLLEYALRRWSVDCSPEHSPDPKEHRLWLNNSQTLYGVKSATLPPGYGDPAAQDIKMEITHE